MTYRGTIAYRTGTLGAHIYEAFSFCFLKALRYLERNSPDDSFYLTRGQSCILHESAHHIVLDFKGDWFLMLDSDHVFEPSAFAEMISCFEGENDLGKPLDVLSGWIQKRQPPYTPCAFTYDFDPEKNPVNLRPDPTDGFWWRRLHKIDVAGCAALMVRRRVIDKIYMGMRERPFQPRWKCQQSKDFVANESQFQKLWKAPRLYSDGLHGSDPFFWEDFSFFWRVKLAGFEAYLAPYIQFPHLEVKPVDPGMAQYDWASLKGFSVLGSGGENFNIPTEDK